MRHLSSLNPKFLYSKREEVIYMYRFICTHSHYMCSGLVYNRIQFSIKSICYHCNKFNNKLLICSYWTLSAFFRLFCIYLFWSTKLFFFSVNLPKVVISSFLSLWVKPNWKPWCDIILTVASGLKSTIHSPVQSSLEDDNFIPREMVSGIVF